MKKVRRFELILTIVVILFTTNLYAQNLCEMISEGGVGLREDAGIGIQATASPYPFKALASITAITDTETSNDILIAPWVPPAGFKVYTFYEYNSYADMKIKVSLTNSAGISGSSKFGPYISEGPGYYYFWVEFTNVPVDYYAVKTTIINKSTGASKSASVKLSVEYPITAIQE